MGAHKDASIRMDSKVTHKRLELEALPYYRLGQVQLGFDVFTVQTRTENLSFSGVELQTVSPQPRSQCDRRTEIGHAEEHQPIVCGKTHKFGCHQRRHADEGCGASQAAADQLMAKGP